MNGHVIAHCDDFAATVEDGAGIIATLFYVRRECAATKRSTHLFSDGMENILEDFELDGVDAHASEVYRDDVFEFFMNKK